ncbi:hypothetical protein [Pararhizobium haloflavum]|nr:hypothetical protein [Pararhizobium haloflavum]
MSLRQVYAVMLAGAVIWHGPTLPAVLIALALFWFFGHWLHE